MTSPAVLVTGGAGFVGSHTCKALAAAGYLPVVYDDLSSGVEDAVRWGPLEVGDIADEARLEAVFETHRPIAVMHFAGFIEAGASVHAPERFYRNNVAGSLSLLRAMRRRKIDRIVFSSSAAVYGDRHAAPISETDRLRPANPYGHSKLMVEEILRDLAADGGTSYCTLRYFNAAGADKDGELRERHDPETHLIPLVLRTAYGLRPEIRIFGTDYDTPDGTCIRDYVHVGDLAEAHVLACRRLLDGGGNLTANLGTGRGHSVREVIQAVEAVTGRPVRVRDDQRRAGDPAVLVAAVDVARRELGWAPARPALAAQIRDAARGIAAEAALSDASCSAP